LVLALALPGERCERRLIDALLGQAVDPAPERCSQRVALGELADVSEQRKPRNGTMRCERMLVAPLARNGAAQLRRQPHPVCSAEHSIDFERMEIEIHVAALAAGGSLPQVEIHVLFRRTGRYRRKNR
jgi:hypothetical protein